VCRSGRLGGLRCRLDGLGDGGGRSSVALNTSEMGTAVDLLVLRSDKGLVGCESLLAGCAAKAKLVIRSIVELHHLGHVHRFAANRTLRGSAKLLHDLRYTVISNNKKAVKL